MGLKWEDNGVKVDWRTRRRVLYTALIVWAFAVRGFKIDPFGLAAMIPLAWVMDVLFIVAFAILVWHLIQSREKIASTT